MSLGPSCYGSFEALWPRTSKRRMGIVFWDAERFESTTLQRAFDGIQPWQQAEREGEGNKSPEENLQLTTTTVPYVRELMEAFGPIG
ncbi:hypothetical protein NLG97_g10263 [Lecanicillium saksenae]|uniref:Uncharacterized protein n=1 Tax=Lecanicillium saksenae TaxID=468837 RepID=A0ACC1QGW4_9HYPO|nr:hypothetical protein NLG97_g10263 [Lecanicillium saksenae]